MQIHKVNVYKVSLPFTGDFSISRLKGLSSIIIVVEVISDHGEIKGYGEALPVEFITGETPASVVKDIKLFTHNNLFPWNLNDVSQIWDFADCFPNGKEHNAAICTLEMSLLDALAKRQDKSIIEYFPKELCTNSIFYGATIPLAEKQRIMELCKMIRKMRINKLRVKMGKEFKQNQDAIETVKLMFEDDCDIRLDPNSAWDRDLAFKHIPLIKEHKIKILEEPMIPNDPNFAEFAEKIQAEGIILMACETATTLTNVKEIVNKGLYQMINVKLSRNGGFRRALKIIEYLRTKGISFQIGCSVGESGILSAAGRALCLLCKDALYYDGSYDEFLLKKNITKENVSFGLGGKAGPLPGPGLGVEINMQNLKQLSDPAETITILRP